jgi:hypothetical protein
MGMLDDSVNFIKYKYSTERIDLIELLINNKQYDLITKIIISEKIPADNKIIIIKRIINGASNNISKIFSKIPDMYRFIETNDGLKGYIKTLIENNLLKIKAEDYYAEQIIRGKINRNFNDEVSRFYALEFTEFFVNSNLVDMNNINWNYNGEIISSAAVACIKNNTYLLKYLYNLPNYKDLDKNVSDASDKIILSEILKYGFSRELLAFIKSVNFEATPSKLKHIENELLKIKEQNNKKIDKIIIEEIIYTFLRKTKKEYYKEMLKAIESLKTNIDGIALADKRKQLVGVLKDFNTVLLEQVPAKTNISSVRVIKK